MKQCPLHFHVKLRFSISLQREHRNKNLCKTDIQKELERILSDCFVFLERAKISKRKKVLSGFKTRNDLLLFPTGQME